MKYNVIYRSLLFGIWLICLVSCVDDTFDNQTIRPGESHITATFEFNTFVPQLGSRSAGDSYDGIRNLHILIFDQNGTQLKRYIPIGLESDSVTVSKDVYDQDKAQLKMTLPTGKYQMYAVANIDRFYDDYIRGDRKKIENVDDLKSIELTWNLNSDGTLKEKNDEMLGIFTLLENKGSEDADPVITINKSNVGLHAYLRRAASKVTVAYNGSTLKPGVFIYIKSVTIKDIPGTCWLGKQKTVDNINDLIHSGETVKYSTEGVPYDENYPVLISNATPFYPSKEIWEDGNSKWVLDPEGHSSKSENSLFFYENIQGFGVDKSQQDNNNDGLPDNRDIEKDDKPYGTYIEVEAYYRSVVADPERAGEGPIKYRFMLGKNETTDYNAARNCHYKLTLKFNGYANDVDWHIEYEQPVLEVSQPKVFNYQGKIFEPDSKFSNLGHEFSTDNVIKVRSYDKATRDKIDWTVSYRDPNSTTYSDHCDWLECVYDPTSTAHERAVTFRVPEEEVWKNMREIDIDSALQNTAPKSGPYNLADWGGAKDKYGVQCTANCYLIDAPGTYMLPMVYGNSIHNGLTNANSYKFTGSSDANNILRTFKNHLKDDITDPYIKNNKHGGVNLQPKSASVIWQDENGLIENVRYDDTAYGGMGGIIFSVPTAKICQGNAIIAVKDAAGTVMWSWHIWVTRFDFDKTIKVTSYDTNLKFDVMSVNLGWCSPHKFKIRYFKRRECVVKFTAGNLSDSITIVQESHMAFPRGNNVYYQWGRKDPFIGTNSNWQNKVRYDGAGKEYGVWDNPPRLTDDNPNDTTLNQYRLTTREALHLMIQKPDTWHNPKRRCTGVIKDKNGKDSVYLWASDNKTYANLWEGKSAKNLGMTFKTVYDPCPVGYQIGTPNSVCGFTSIGENTNDKDYWMDVRFENILTGNPAFNPTAEYNADNGIYEFYTNREKYQSIIFPETGYRDWDSFAGVYGFGYIGYVWLAGNRLNDDNNSYNFEFSRADITTGLAYVRPKNYFYPCDGFPVRPVLWSIHGTE